jgi:hypothetical protein
MEGIQVAIQSDALGVYELCSGDATTVNHPLDSTATAEQG